MRFAFVAVCLALAACAAPSGGTSERLTPNDSATQLLAGGPLTLTTVTQRAQEGMDPVVTLTVTTADGRSLVFQEANHTTSDLAAQAPGGPLANVMGFFADERPTLYQRVDSQGAGAPFICAPEGPQYLGVFRAANGEVAVVGLKSAFEFEDAGTANPSPLPYSPDHVCARMKFRAS